MVILATHAAALPSLLSMVRTENFGPNRPLDPALWYLRKGGLPSERSKFEDVDDADL